MPPRQPLWAKAAGIIFTIAIAVIGVALVALVLVFIWVRITTLLKAGC